MIQRFLKLFSSDHERSSRVKKNIGLSFIIKGIGLALGFIKVPIVLGFLDVDRYGIWLTISSIILWINYFDFGIGHGLRNHFAAAIAEGNLKKARSLVSVAYFYLSFIFLGVLVIGLPIIYLLDWNIILNTNLVTNDELQNTVAIVFCIFIVKFVSNLITSILRADQRPALAESLAPVGSLISLILVLVLKSNQVNSLIFACAAIALPDTLLVVFANYYFFSTRYKDFAPRWRMVDRAYFKDIFNLGMKFFWIQIGGLVMFSSSNIIITQVINPAEVTVFNVARQYYSLPFMFFSIVLLPLWSAVTDAYVKSDFDWIRNTMGRLRTLGLLFFSMLIILFLVEDFVIDLWVKDKVKISDSLALSLVVFNGVSILFSPYSQFINGVGKLRLSLWVVSFKTLLFIPVAVFLAESFGSAGLMMAMVLVNSMPSSIIEFVQYKKIINHRAFGIWNK